MIATILSVLAVEPAVDDLPPLVAALTGAGFQVTASGTFAQARALLDAHPPTVLVAAVRLGVYNGLHLVLRGKALKPDLVALVTSPIADPVLQKDAEALGATFMVKPIADKDLIAATLRTLFAGHPSAGPIRPPFERRGHQRRAAAQSHVPEGRAAERRQDLVSRVGGSRSAFTADE